MGGNTRWHTGEPAVDGDEPGPRERARWTDLKQRTGHVGRTGLEADRPRRRIRHQPVSLPAVVVETAHYADAIEKVREMARSIGVDGWYTCDHTHYAQVAKYRNAAAGEREKPRCKGPRSVASRLLDDAAKVADSESLHDVIRMPLVGWPRLH